MCRLAKENWVRLTAFTVVTTAGWLYLRYYNSGGSGGGHSSGSSGGSGGGDGNSGEGLQVSALTLC